MFNKCVVETFKNLLCFGMGLLGGKHDLLVQLLHFRTTDVCASLLSRLDEPQRKDVIDVYVLILKQGKMCVLIFLQIVN